MRNFLAGLAGVVFAALVLLWLSETPVPTDLYGYGYFAPLLTGLDLLSKTLYWIADPSWRPLIIVAWLIAGAVSGPFTRPGWNLMRTSFWSGAIVTVAAIAAGGTVFWTSAERNSGILILFLCSIVSAQLSLLSAAPIAYLHRMLTRKQEERAAPVIETVCECGARFRSNPLICSECGRRLRSDENP